MSAVWMPPCSIKQAEIVNDKRRYLLVTGPKKTTKTIGCCLKVADHMYQYGGANVAIVTHRIHTAKNGAWKDLTDVIENMYQKDGGILPYTREPGLEPDTKKNVFRVRAADGRESSASLIGVSTLHNIEKILKSSRYSMVYITEADLFNDARILIYFADQLRMMAAGIPFEAHQVILDCNPPKEGEEHWLYDAFFTEDGIGGKQKDLTEWGVIKCTLDDNPWMTERERADLINNYSNSPTDYARYVLGEWVASKEGSFFERIFRENEHLIGMAAPGEETRVLVPDATTDALCVGLDLGSVRNHAAVLFTPRQLGAADFAFDVIDEVVSVGIGIKLETVIGEILRKVNYWLDFHEKRTGRRLPVRCWADNTSGTYIAAADKNERRIALEVSKGLLDFTPIRKGAGSVEDRLKNTSLLLNSGRIAVAVRCKHLVKALQTLKAPLKKDVGRHVFDAFSYGICSELPAAWGGMSRPSTASRNDMIGIRL